MIVIFFCFICLCNEDYDRKKKSRLINHLYPVESNNESKTLEENSNSSQISTANSTYSSSEQSEWGSV